MLLRIIKLLLIVSFVGSTWASTSPIQDNLLSMIKPLLEQQEALEVELEKLDAERKGAYSIEQFRVIEEKIDSVNQSLADILLKLRVLGQGISQLPDDVEAIALMDGELEELLSGEDGVDQEFSEDELLELQMAESFAAASEENQENKNIQDVEDTQVIQDTEELDSLVSFAQEIGDEEMTALLVSESSDSETPESEASELEEYSQSNVSAPDGEYDEWGDVDEVSSVDSNAAWQARQQIAQASAAKAAQARGNVNSQFGVIAQERARKRAELGEGLQAIAQGMQQVVVEMEVEKRRSEAAALERRQNAQKAAFQQMVADKKVARDYAMQQRAQEFAARDAAQQASVDDWNAREAARKKRQEQDAAMRAERKRKEKTYTTSAQNTHLVNTGKSKQYAVQHMLCYFPKSTNSCVGIGYGYDKPCRLKISGKAHFNTLAIKGRRMYVASGVSLHEKMQEYGRGAVIRWGDTPPKQLTPCVVE